jgi:hypothetical protein
MPLVQGVTPVTLAAPIPNLLVGSIYERPTFKALVRYFITADAAGTMRLQINHGSRTIMETAPVSRANRQPLVPDDMLLEAVVMPYEQIVMRASNTAAGPNDIFWRVDIRPIR